MITIKHNFDESKFKWLWAKYVNAGNIEKHCTACLKGPYSSKLNGTKNKLLHEQTTMVMDEVPEDLYEAIYFCGVIKKVLSFSSRMIGHNISILLSTCSFIACFFLGGLLRLNRHD